jgi:hypothetical protein
MIFPLNTGFEISMLHAERDEVIDKPFTARKLEVHWSDFDRREISGFGSDADECSSLASCDAAWNGK